MANNRMFVRCRNCGAIIRVASLDMDGYHLSGQEEAINSFFREHAFCDKPLDKRSVDSIDTPFECVDSFENRFELAYEFEDKKEEQPNYTEAKEWDDLC